VPRWCVCLPWFHADANRRRGSRNKASTPFVCSNCWLGRNGLCPKNPPLYDTCARTARKQYVNEQDGQPGLSPRSAFLSKGYDFGKAVVWVWAHGSNPACFSNKVPAPMTVFKMRMHSQTYVPVTELADFWQR
jgi:hypothetical protein